MGAFISPAGLPAPGQTTKIQLATSALNQPVAIAYGRHIVGGNLILQQQSIADGPTTLFFAHGEGTWSGPVFIWVNGVLVDITNASLFHFHPGLDGENDDETDPSVANQKVCSFFPIGFAPRLTFSRTAYSAFVLPVDPYSPTNGFDIRGIYDGIQVRLFDSSGTQTLYATSDDPAWCALDLLIRRFLWPFGPLGAELPASVKARIDFPAWVDWSDNWCDGAVSLPAGARSPDALAGTFPRWRTNVAFVSPTDLMRALELMLMLGQGYLIERNGKFAGLPDKPRDPVLTLTQDRIVANSFTAGSVNLRDAANKFIFSYRDISEASSAHPEMAFQSRNKTIEDEDHQDRVGLTLDYSVDLGNSFSDIAERLAKFERARTLGYPRTMQCTAMADAPGVRDLAPGDVVTGPRKRDYSDSLVYQVAQKTPKPDGTADLQLQEFSNDMFSDKLDV